jgi:hypothetical protein
MHLDELPVEIISRICRILGLSYVRHWGGPLTAYYTDEDFQSLRRVCKVFEPVKARITCAEKT